MSDRPVTAIAAASFAAVLALCVTVLAWHGTIGGEAAVAFFSGLVGVVIGGSTHAVGVKSGVRSARAGAVAATTAAAAAVRPQDVTTAPVAGVAPSDPPRR